MRLKVDINIPELENLSHEELIHLQRMATEILNKRRDMARRVVDHLPFVPTKTSTIAIIKYIREHFDGYSLQQSKVVADFIVGQL